MSQSITTSIRLSPTLRERLDNTAKKLHRGKNWIINHALIEYLEKIDRTELAQEAARQSKLASRSKRTKEEQAWEKNIDSSDWT